MMDNRYIDDHCNSNSSSGTSNGEYTAMRRNSRRANGNSESHVELIPVSLSFSSSDSGPTISLPRRRAGSKLQKWGCVGLLLLVAIGGGVWVYTANYRQTSPIPAPQNVDPLLDPPDVLIHMPPSPMTSMGQYQKAAVVSNGGPCAAIGKSILEKNGNAVEAAIATLFCDGVACMQSMGIGGGFLMTIYKRDEGRAYVLNAREAAPATATEDMYHGAAFAPQIGARSAGIPAELKGYHAAFNKFKSGNVKWSELVEPTIKLCEQGVPVNQHLAFNIKNHESDIRMSESLSQILLREDGTLPQFNETIKLPKLAATLKVIAYSPIEAEELYNGSLTKAFVQDIREAGGIITEEDMANYNVRWEEPVTAKLSGNITMYTVPPPGSGSILAFMLQALDGFIPQKSASDATTIQRIAEIFKHAYGRRTEFGDPHYTNITQLLHDLSSPDYIKAVREKVHDDWTSQDHSYYGAKFDLTEDHGTANMVVLGPNGDAVSVTSTVNLVFGSKFVSKSTGIILNDQMDDFSAPNITNFFGMPPSPSNFIRPGKRPMSSMCPAIFVEADGRVRLILGSAGGTKITTSIAWVSMMNLWFGMNIKQAIDEPRIHHQLFPMQLSYEYGILKSTVDAAKKIGHKTNRLGNTWRSCVTGIAAYKDGKVEGVSDFRRPGNVQGF
ncbi:hypothetical protein LSTR_LSTR010676 [Laodelphax striatellus]|uniref:Gamma-glutamyltranspeptidase 1 n=1 Tax=Laodelphax striatellus TaxID=195883 RepID=A0A482WSH2_LAOST|nr:hypothetical protein LSTR_LSTR010676 [Laodelphax striatellus]